MNVDYGVTLTWDEWKTMGLLLSRCRDDLVHACVKTSKTMGKTSKYTKIIEKRLKRINLAGLVWLWVQLVWKAEQGDAWSYSYWGTNGWVQMSHGKWRDLWFYAYDTSGSL